MSKTSSAIESVIKKADEAIQDAMNLVDSIFSGDDNEKEELPVQTRTVVRIPINLDRLERLGRGEVLKYRTPSMDIEVVLKR